MNENNTFENLCIALKNSFAEDKNSRNEAEQFLSIASKQPGILSSLVAVITHKGLPDEIQITAAVYLKNEIQNKWFMDGVSYSEEETQLRNAIYPLLFQIGLSNQPIWKQMLHTFRMIVFSDPQEKHEGWIKMISNDLNQRDDVDRLQITLEALNTIIRLEESTPNLHLFVPYVISLTFKPLIQAASDLTKIGVEQPKVATLMKIICKIYWSCLDTTNTKDPVFLQTLDEWMQLIEYIATQNGNASELSQLGEDMEAAPFFKMQKRAIQIVHRLFLRFAGQEERGNPSKASPLIEKFINSWAGRFTEIFIDRLQKKARGEILLSEISQTYMLEYIGEGCTVANVYKRCIKPNGRFLLFEYCFGLLQYGEKDEEEWNDDPVEFVRAAADDVLLSSGTLREAAGEMVGTIARLRGKDFLELIYEFVCKISENYAAVSESSQQSEQLAKGKDGALLMVSSIAGRLTKRRAVPIEEFLFRFVYPDLRSPNKFLRFRALIVYNRFIPTIKKFNHTFALIDAFHAVLQCTTDSEFVVRLAAGTIICVFLEVDEPSLSNAIIQKIPTLLEQLFSLVNEGDSGLVLQTIETLVSAHEMEIRPYAKMLSAALSQAIVKACRQELEESSVEYITSAARSALQSLTLVLEAMKDNPSTYIELYPLVLPALINIFDSDLLEYYEEAIYLVSLLTYYIPEIPVDVWTLFERLYICISGKDTQQVTEEGSDAGHPYILDRGLSPIQNFIYRGEQHFAVATRSDGMSYRSLVVKMAEKCIAKTEPLEYCYEILCVLFESTLKSRCAVDMMAPSFQLLSPTLTELAEDPSSQIANSIKRTLFKLIAAMLYYDAVNFFDILVKSGKTEWLFKTWIDNISTLKRMDELKMTILALTEYLRSVLQRKEMVPICLASPAVVEEIVTRIGVMVREQMKLREKTEASEVKSFDDESVDSEQALEDYEDAVNGADQLFGDKSSDRWKQLFEGADDDEDDESFITDDVSSDFRASPLEVVDELQYLADTISMVPQDTQTQIEKWLGTQQATLLESTTKYQQSKQKA